MKLFVKVLLLTSIFSFDYSIALERGGDLHIDAQETEKVSTICGVYEFSFGDRLRIDKSLSDLKDPYLDKTDRVLLVRDENLQEFIENPDFKRLCIRGIVVEACDSELSTEAACIQSGGGKAISILEWLSPEPIQK